MSLKKLGRYDIVKPLGKGAMGLVYEAHDPNIDRRVAIKTIRVDQLSPELAADYESRFRAEARAGGRLQHPNIIGVYDAGRDEGMAFMVMELVRGGDLKQLLEQGSRLGLARSFGLTRELLSALSFAHEQGIIHRDIKPANVMLDSNGRVKLGDFGVARITYSGDATRTQGSMVGTLKYMSPEQVQGLPVDLRTDLFAAGVVLYQLLTGKKPFDGPNDFAIMQAIAQQEPAPPSSVDPTLPPAVDAVLAKALAKDRDQRYASAREFMVALRTAVASAGREAAALTQPAAVASRAIEPDAAGILLTPLAPVTPVTPLARSGPSATGTLPTDEPGEPSSGGLNTRTNIHLPPVSPDPSTTSPSAVAQEMELLYWKDIQESSDPVDFQEFLDRFPAGIYAGLAARRLRRLARSLVDGTGSQSVVGTLSFGADPGAEPAAAEDASRITQTSVGDEPWPAGIGGDSVDGSDAPVASSGAEALPLDEARALAAARAAEEEARWQEALRLEAVEAAREHERRWVETSRGHKASMSASSSFIDLSTAPAPLASLDPVATSASPPPSEAPAADAASAESSASRPRAKAAPPRPKATRAVAAVVAVLAVAAAAAWWSRDHATEASPSTVTAQPPSPAGELPKSR